MNSQKLPISDSDSSEQSKSSPVAETTNLRRSTRVSRPPDRLNL